jgi:hypothetical protein
MIAGFRSKRCDLPVNVVHGEGLDVVLAENLLLAAVNVSQTDVDELLDADALVILDPAEAVLLIFLGQASQESHGHAVNVSTVRSLGSVDIGVCIDPDDGHLSASSFSNGLCCAGDRSNGNGVVTAEGQDKAAVASVLVDLLAELLGDGTDAARVLHTAVFGVFLGDNVGVLVDFTIVVHVELELFSQLFDETGLDQSHGSSINTSLALSNVLDTLCLFGTFCLLTWPPQKPTATRPNSLREGRNLGWRVGASILSVRLGVLGLRWLVGGRNRV